MSMVENNQSLNNILNKLGIQPQEQKKRADGGSLARRFSEADDNTAPESGPLCSHGKCGFYCLNGAVFNCNWDNGHRAVAAI